MVSRVGKMPIPLTDGAKATLDGNLLTVTGKLGTLKREFHPAVELKLQDDTLYVVESSNPPRKVNISAMQGLSRSLANNMVIGVTKGFEKKLALVGVGYRAKLAVKAINLELGFSHPVQFKLPEGVTAEVPSQTEIVLKGTDKQLVNEMAAQIRRIRPPEPYKGKGVRYADETIIKKEVKKK